MENPNPRVRNPIPLGTSIPRDRCRFADRYPWFGRKFRLGKKPCRWQGPSSLHRAINPETRRRTGFDSTLLPAQLSSAID